MQKTKRQVGLRLEKIALKAIASVCLQQGKTARHQMQLLCIFFTTSRGMDLLELKALGGGGTEQRPAASVK